MSYWYMTRLITNIHEFNYNIPLIGLKCKPWEIWCLANHKYGPPHQWSMLWQKEWCLQIKSQLILEKKKRMTLVEFKYGCVSNFLISIRQAHTEQFLNVYVLLTRVHDKRSKAKPSTINFPEDWAQLCLCIAPIIMVSQYCTEIKSNNQV